MALSYRARRRWSLFVLLVGMPAYVVLAVTLLSHIDRLPFLAEVLVYVAVGIGWVFPLRFVFLGVGKPDPDQADDDAPARGASAPPPER
ncbi:DUF2842 domain-containing protein [Tropicimonas sp.]|uniref:DUF2842 domain-containing protein n=1 Tax=Tropicimonas sp. TaxID=2067044 RepID=UPI003A86D14B